MTSLGHIGKSFSPPSFLLTKLNYGSHNERPTTILGLRFNDVTGPVSFFKILSFFLNNISIVFKPMTTGYEDGMTTTMTRRKREEKRRYRCPWALGSKSFPPLFP